MTGTDKIEIRIERDFKERASKAASECGLTLSAVTRCLLRYWLDCGAPDPTVPDPRELPTVGEAYHLTQSLAQAAFQLHKMLIQFKYNPHLFGQEALQELNKIDLSSMNDQVPSQDLPSLRPEEERIMRDEGKTN